MGGERADICKLPCFGIAHKRLAYTFDGGRCLGRHPQTRGGSFRRAQEAVRLGELHTSYFTR